MPFGGKLFLTAWAGFILAVFYSHMAPGGPKQNAVHYELTITSEHNRNAILGNAAGCNAPRALRNWRVRCTDGAARTRVVVIPTDKDSMTVTSWDCGAAMAKTGHWCGVKF